MSEWREAEDWHQRVSTLRSQVSSDYATSASTSDLTSSYKLDYDLNQIKALSSFEIGDLVTSKEYVERQSDPRHRDRDPEVFPLWAPGQLLKTSQLLLLKAVTFQAGEEGSDSDNTSVASEGEYDPK